MQIIFILLPILLIIFFINGRREGTGKKPIAEALALPIALFVVMIVVLWDMDVDMMHAVITFGFGAIIGSLLDHSSD